MRSEITFLISPMRSMRAVTSEKKSPAASSRIAQNHIHSPRTRIVRAAGTMRPLTDVETQTLFTKLANYTGRSLTQLIAPSETGSDDDRHVFRLHESRVYYVRLSLANLATSVARDNLLCLGTCIGKFTKTGKFRLHITALDVIAPHARYKLWVKANGEMPFLYGGNVVKAHVGRWSEDCPEHSGLVILSMDDTPLGFGVTARSTAEARKLDPTAVVAFRQGDVGEYLREVRSAPPVILMDMLTLNRKIRSLPPKESWVFLLCYKVAVQDWVGCHNNITKR